MNLKYSPLTAWNTKDTMIILRGNDKQSDTAAQLQDLHELAYTSSELASNYLDNME